MICSPKKNSAFGESISDLMTGLMMIFLFIGPAFLFQLEMREQDALQIKRQIYTDLSQEFSEGEMAQWSAEFDRQTMAISFKEPDVLFDVGKSNLKPRFQEILSDFFPRYINILRKPQYVDKISEIRIEGYASIELGEDPNSDKVYFYNMQLSQDRARNVLQYVFGIPELSGDKEWLRETVITNGYSYAGASKKSSTQQQRRVEFRVMTTDEQELKKIVEGKI